MKYQFVFLSLLTLSLAGYSQTVAGKQTAICSPGNMTGAAPELVEKVDQFLKTLQSAISTDDRARVASLTNYPITVATGDKLIRINTKKEFVREYGQIFTARLKALVKQQNAGCVNLMDEKGFMIANGEIWFNEFPGDHMLISTINPPIPDSGKQAGLTYGRN